MVKSQRQETGNVVPSDSLGMTYGGKKPGQRRRQPSGSEVIPWKQYDRKEGMLLVSLSSLWQN